mmetsp:Transcript_16717/g.26998  ORF Transcript_16717/g.26998 Transcript_16717/m.26998 type:complete len:794 (+) Transcript_16717:191-2572(+)
MGSGKEANDDKNQEQEQQGQDEEVEWDEQEKLEAQEKAHAKITANSAKNLATIEVPDSARPDLGLGAIRRCAMPFGPELSVKGMRTLYEVFRNTAENHSDRPCMGTRSVDKDGKAGPFNWLTYREVQIRAMNFAAGLMHLDVVQPNEENHRLLGFFAVNQRGLVICEIGAMSQRVVPVPLYATLGMEAVEHIIEQTEMRVVVCNTSEFEDTLLKSEKVMDQLTTVILLDEDVGGARLDELVKAASKFDVKVYTLPQVEELGEAHPRPVNIPSGKDLAVLCYTSGSTGMPKGVLITHSGLISAVAGLRHFGLDIHPTDVHLSYLPLAHIFERVLTYAMFYGGASVGFYRGSPKHILGDLKELRPTIFPTVPRLLNKMHDSIWTKVREAGGAQKIVFENVLQAKLEALHGVTTSDKLYALMEDADIKDWLFGRTLKDKVEDLRTGRILRQIAGGSDEDVDNAGGFQQWLFKKVLSSKSHKDPKVEFGSDESESTSGKKPKPLSDKVFDRFIFKAIKEKLGLDRTRIIAVGSAPITGEVLDFFRCVLGIPVLNAFGSTESSCVISITHPDDVTSGHVGIPVPCNEVRLNDVSDMGYKATDTEHNGEPCLGRGEICFRGPNVFQGYYKMEEKTAETIDDEGWCMTGDIGMWTADGKLKIIDRKKNIFKLAQGEYIAPEKVENAYCRADLIESMFVYGDSEQSQLVAVVHPDADVVKETGFDMESKELHDKIQEELDQQADAAGLKGFERVRAFHVEPKPFSDVDGIVTATAKLKRSAAEKYYKDVIDELYKELKEKK